MFYLIISPGSLLLPSLRVTKKALRAAVEVNVARQTDSTAAKPKGEWDCFKVSNSNLQQFSYRKITFILDYFQTRPSYTNAHKIKTSTVQQEESGYYELSEWIVSEVSFRISRLISHESDQDETRCKCLGAAPTSGMESQVRPWGSRSGTWLGPGWSA